MSKDTGTKVLSNVVRIDEEQIRDHLGARPPSGLADRGVMRAARLLAHEGWSSTEKR